MFIELCWREWGGLGECWGALGALACLWCSACVFDYKEHWRNSVWLEFPAFLVAPPWPALCRKGWVFHIIYVELKKGEWVSEAGCHSKISAAVSHFQRQSVLNFRSQFHQHYNITPVMPWKILIKWNPNLIRQTIANKLWATKPERGKNFVGFFCLLHHKWRDHSGIVVKWDCFGKHCAICDWTARKYRTLLR